MTSLSNKCQSCISNFCPSIKFCNTSITDLVNSTGTPIFRISFKHPYIRPSRRHSLPFPSSRSFTLYTSSAVGLKYVLISSHFDSAYFIYVSLDQGHPTLFTAMGHARYGGTGSRAASGKMTPSGTSNRINYYVIFMEHT